MIRFKTVFKTTQDGDGIFHGRLLHHDPLETTLQCRILFNVFAVFVKGRGADAVAVRRVASIGLSRLAASIDPSVFPAPTRLWISSMNRMMPPSAFFTSSNTAFRRSSNSPRYFAPAIRAPISSSISFFSFERLRHIALHDPPGDALDDRCLTHTGFTDQHRIVLCLSRQI